MIKNQLKKLGAFAIAAMMAATITPAMAAPTHAAENNADGTVISEEMLIEGTEAATDENEDTESISEEDSLVQASEPEEQPQDEGSMQEETGTEAQQSGEEPVSNAASEEKSVSKKMATVSTSGSTAKYKAFLNYRAEEDDDGYITSEADYDELLLEGTFPDIALYNEDVIQNGGPSSLKITESDMKKITVTAQVGDQTYTAKLAKGSARYSFSTKFAKVPLGTPVTVKIKMGSYTKTENLVVSKWSHPTTKAKWITYDGKSHKGALIVKIGKTTLKEGVDYCIKSETIKNVGDGWVRAISLPTCKYRFITDSVGFFVHPKGTSLKSAKESANAVTVKWSMQSSQMAKARISGYQIQVATNGKFKKAKTYTVKGYKSTSRTIKRLKAKQKYYVRVRTYMIHDGSKICSSWTKAKAVKTGYYVKRDLPAVKLTSAKKKSTAATVHWKKFSKKNLKKVKYVQIQYSTSKTFKTGVKTTYVKAKNKSCKIKKLAKSKRYFIRIRSYKRIGKTVHVSKWSAVKAAGTNTTISGTVYGKSLKEGNIVYCCTKNSVYKVDLKSRKSRRLDDGDDYSIPRGMKKKGKYLYYLSPIGTGGTTLRRVDVNSGRTKSYFIHEVDPVTAYVLGKNRIYYRYGGKNYSMNYSGKDRKRIKKTITNKICNAKGYNAFEVQFENSDGAGAKEWLKLPSGKTIYLGKYYL